MSNVFLPLFTQDQIENLESSTFKIFDWRKCVDIICKKNIYNAKFGLHEDWKPTSATGLKDGYPAYEDESDIGTFLGSWWATPCILDIDTDEKYFCFKEIEEEKFSTTCIEHAEDWWPQKAAEYYAQKRFGEE